MPLLSVIIPCYKVEAYVGACLQSVLDSVSPENDAALELVIVDDGTPDNSPAVIEAFIKQKLEPRGIACCFIRQANAGLSEARNSGMREARGDYWFFLDSDDVLTNHAVDRMLAVIRGEAPDIIEFDALVFAQEQELRQPQRPSLYHRYFQDVVQKGLQGDDKMLRAFEECRWYVWSRCYRKNLFDCQKFERGRLFEDMMTVPYLYLGRPKISSLPKVLVGYRQNAGSITANMSRRHVDDIFFSLQKTLDVTRRFSGSFADFAALELLKLKTWRLIVAYSVKRSLKTGEFSYLAAVRAYQRTLAEQYGVRLGWQFGYFGGVLLKRLAEKAGWKAA